MRRILTLPLAFVAGLALFLNGCAGESPTGPAGGGGGGTGGTGGGGGSCNVSISLAATSVTPLAGTAVVIRATVKKGGVPVPDGTSVFFSTDFGFFLETGLNSVSKVTVGGVADVTLGSTDSGSSHVKASLECATTPLTIEFGNVPTEGPFISSIVPNQGSCAGGDTVAINGGRFGTNVATTRVTFGGVNATIVSVADNQIVVKTPVRNLANPQVPEAVDVVVTIGSGTSGAKVATFAKGFTYSCVNPNKRIFISSVVPNSGPPEGGQTVAVNGGNFGTNVSTTRVTFGGVSATVVSVSDSVITVLTPRHPLANPNVPEAVDVGVTIDLGLVSQQTAVCPQCYTYRGAGAGGGGGNCNTIASLFISQVTPNSGPPDGGTTVTIAGGGFGMTLGTTRVEFGGKPAQITSVSPTSITVTTPQRTLANPSVPETVDVKVTIDVGGPAEACATLSNAFTYTTVALTPVIYSISPRTGPNDASTRITIFGTGFQFPTQVFMTGGSCGSQRVEATVVSIKSDQIVFLSPIAANGNVCLANGLVDVVVLNPTTGKTASCMACFKYYACPVITAIEPSLGPYTGGTRVVINGHNFEEPVVVSGGTSPWQVISVSSTSIVAITTPPIVTGCSDIMGAVNVTGLTLNCGAISGPTFTFQVASIAPVITAVTPQLVPEAGGVIVTVTGKNFFDNLRLIVHLPGGDVTLFPTIVNSTTLTFTAPAFTGALRTVACVTGGMAGTMNVDTPVKFDIVNLTTKCQTSDEIIYQPNDTTCRLGSVLAIAGSGTTAAVCSPYTGSFTASGGSPPYNIVVSGQPAWMTVTGTNPVTLGGTPPLSTTGAGTANTPIMVSATVTDAASNTATTTLNITLNDPAAPFSVSGPAIATISGTTGGATSAFTASSTAFSPVNWSRTVMPAPAAGSITVSPATGGSTTVNVAAGTSTGTYTVGVTATDTSCGPGSHSGTTTLTLTVN